MTEKKKELILCICLLAMIFAVMVFLLSNQQRVAADNGNITLGQPSPTLTTESNNIAGGLSHNLVLQKDLPGNTDHIMTFKVVPPHYTRNDIISLGKKFNISEPYQIKEGNEGLSIREVDDDIHVLILNSGWIEYWNSNRHSVNSLDIPGNLPSDDEAVTIATKFLRDRDLLPADAELRKIDHVKTYNLGDGGQESVVWEDIEVWYGRKLNGYPVEGTKLMLAIGAHGDPIEFLSNWRNYTPYQEMPVKEPGTAFQDLKTEGVSVGMHMPDKVSISDMYLAYRTKAGSDTEKYLEPVWIFKGNVTENNTSIMPVNAYIPALTDESVKSLSS